jgi:hypothetical protein
VIIGDSGTVAVSADWENWAATRLPQEQWGCWLLIYGNGQFVAVGLKGIILTSPDATTWTKMNSGVTGDFCSIAYGNNKFLVVGWDFVLVSQADGTVGIKKPAIARTPDKQIKFTLADKSLNGRMPFSTSSAPAQVELFNCAGKRILATSVTARNGILSIPTSGLPAGKYVIGIRAGRRDQIRSSFVLAR